MNNDYQQLMQEESHELSPDEVYALSEPWELDAQTDADIMEEINEYLEVA